MQILNRFTGKGVVAPSQSDNTNKTESLPISGVYSETEITAGYLNFIYQSKIIEILELGIRY